MTDQPKALYCPVHGYYEARFADCPDCLIAEVRAENDFVLGEDSDPETDSDNN